MTMRWLLWTAFAALLSVRAEAAGFADWAAVVVAGDNRAHDGSPAEVFDNGRRDIVSDLVALGFNRDNIAQFSVEPDSHPGTQASDPGNIASTLFDLSSRTSSGCFVYITSHGSPDGVVVGSGLWSPKKLAHAVDNACGGRPTVVMISACFSGVFVPVLTAPERLVVTAARPDRTSFGCGNTDKYTYFDQCVLQSFSSTGDFPDLATSAKSCVASRERQMGATPPSDPQIYLGSAAATQLPRWR
jgi:hypothetical protein